MRSTSAVRTTLVAFASAGALIATGIAGSTAAAAEGPAGAPSPTSPTGPLQTVQLALTPRDAAGLQELATNAATIPLATRRARLQQVLAGPDRAAEVARRARSLGFTVTATTSTSVTLTGPASLVAGQFGSARAQDPTGGIGRALPGLPASLRGLVTLAAGGDETRPARHPAVDPAAITQADLYSLYSVAGSPGKPTSSSPAIATLQFSNWTPNDLKLYAQNTGVYGGDTTYNPLTSGAYTAVTVDGGATNSASSAGATEVSLDQSALATVAPSFRQVAYFAPNTALAQADALNQIAQDATSRNIVAVSTSWGLCEPDAYPIAYANPTHASNDAMLQVDLQAVNAALAAGITIFAASGDNGAFDCGSSHPSNFLAVDTPASFPGVIGVGGTSVSKPSPGVYGETSWSGSGGGYSHLFCARASQSAILPASASACLAGPGKARGVPDIAMNGNPSSGLEIYKSGVKMKVGGTSLAAPLAAGSFAQSLGASGYLAGVGDISSAIHGSVGTTGLRDIAPAGWDTVTGGGAPNWTTLGSRVLNTTAVNSVFDVRTGTADGHVQVREMSAASGYQQVVKTIETPLVASGPDWKFLIAPYNNDGRHDLYAILSTGGASGRVEVHVLSEASSYQTYVAHIASGLGTLPPADWQFALSSFGGDGRSDLFAIGQANTGSGKVEVHVLSAASLYTTFLLHGATALPAVSSGSTAWTFGIGDPAGRGDLIGVLGSGTFSGKVEVHTLSAASGYQTFTLHTATPLPAPAGATTEFGITDYNGDTVPDLEFAWLNTTGSSSTEIHILNGAALYSNYVLHTATALPYLDPSTDTVRLVR